ncbi:Uncharacterised protein [Staphylococcus piscifermentans]|nr:Uncharacterised protein [Staphylococcus piscifermentans]
MRQDNVLLRQRLSIKNYEDIGYEDYGIFYTLL